MEYRSKYILRDKMTGSRIRPGDAVTDPRGSAGVLLGCRSPQTPGFAVRVVADFGNGAVECFASDIGARVAGA
jgi:hypothetical protein